MYSYTASVADGAITDLHFLPILYELDDMTAKVVSKSRFERHISDKNKRRAAEILYFQGFLQFSFYAVGEFIHPFFKN